MGVRELLLVRHGESAGNVAAAAAHEAGAEVIDIDQRDADVPLSPLGVEQSRALGPALAEWVGSGDPPLVWSSTYVRAQETGRIGLDEAGLTLPIRLDERIRDRELGVLDLLTFRGVAARYPDEAERRLWLGKFYHRPAGGESWADLMLRVRSFLSDLDRVADGRRVLVLCHDVLVLSFRYVCEQLTEQQVLDISSSTPVRNVSLTRLVREEDQLGWTLVSFNDVSHLHEEEVPVTQHPGERRVVEGDVPNPQESSAGPGERDE
jgi:broad specificity phosphatase PhoE